MGTGGRQQINGGSVTVAHSQSLATETGLAGAASKLQRDKEVGGSQRSAPEHGLPNSPGTPGNPKLAAMMLCALGFLLLKTERATRLQTALLLALLIFWAGVTLVLIKPTKAQSAARAKRFEEALATPDRTGLSRAWCAAIQNVLRTTGCFATGTCAPQVPSGG